MKTNIREVLVIPIVSVILCAAVLRPSAASAASLAASIGVGSSCTSNVSISGTSGHTVSVTSGDDSNITIANTDVVVAQNVSGPGISAQLQPAPTKSGSQGTYSQTFLLGKVTSPVTITFTPIPSSYNGVEFVNECPIGSTPVPSSLTINPVAPASPAYTAPKPTSSPPSSTTASPPASTTTPTATSTSQATPKPTVTVNTTSATITPPQHSVAKTAAATGAAAISIGGMLAILHILGVVNLKPFLLKIGLGKIFF
jgi:hypothetical protein